MPASNHPLATKSKLTTQTTEYSNGGTFTLLSAAVPYLARLGFHSWTGAVALCESGLIQPLGGGGGDFGFATRFGKPDQI